MSSTSTAGTTPRFPFSAVVGHDDLRLALLLNAVHPGVGGVLVRGEKGTAKSTAVRALAALLPEHDVVDGCRFGCDPAAPDPGCPDGPHAAEPAASTRPARLVELPVGATEDRLVGSLDLERALSEGRRAYQPGLLADAHRGVLYVDEVNLLHDHLVDLLLDAAAMGRAHVERDGVSVSHAARFLLVGTMNPEEGELRPQLLDRFGLTVEVRASRDVATRVEVTRRRMAFEDDPAGFTARYAGDEAATAGRLRAAQERVGSVRVSDRELERIAFVCARFDVDGMRADLVITRAAAAHAAWEGRTAVTEDDVRVAARLALPHRRRRDPFDEPGLDEKDLDEALRDAEDHLGPDDDPDDGPDDPDGGPDDGGPGGDQDPGDGGPDGPGSDGGAPDAPGTDPGGADGSGTGGDPAAPRDDAGGGQEGEEGPQGSDAPAPDPADGTPQGGDDGEGRAVVLGDTARLRRATVRKFTVPGLGAGAPGRRSRARTDTGRVVRPTGSGTARAADLHLPATVLAAAPHQATRGRSGPGLLVHRTDLRRAQREGREGNLVLFVVDASGSMAARKRMTAVSGAVLGLLRDAYQRRDKVGLVTFRGRAAELALPPTSSVPTAQQRLAKLRTGGRTPLAGGLLKARAVLDAERRRDPRRRPLVVLLTDGRATVPARDGGDPVSDARRAAGLLAADGVHTVVVDCEGGHVRLGLAAPLAAAAGGELVTLDELTADSVGDLVRSARTAQAA
ncbi:ChlI component of cobalt chelatase involved in B12 biosynthesis [Pseudonocardia sp. Ae168_Ps1]|uniref:putative cobaltochelatase n=1 Tax=unclassified Pseudonocardia TaxID=2619320 RepID=UPI00094B50D3|nr:MULTISPECIES: putative cobaltochelatase [unclassified Pseudonocardia]OLL72988.1 ChlI component of cobalt chelatase involved in B12 biosynthesis [Pseudonocardia sp. Ae150A_Ps1]OLL78965.1 ChlI component of cobalt chelatase involved in B12 biosynthesis [Pseudonocardia sp. Ae168_Ps1]OLL86898.1 ChlI component of cobalt chelatase involved in B12 biosynthesis [Pseudonocardia sp. Ae263_Ps1]OLL93057.1 ChlI component of cobalt chelatase involved in B12 biosynthesis [Pseudonocardia sp. Ae356_Ps1]